MVAVFREVRRVLRADGTCWVNLGDSYGSGSRTSQIANSFGGPRDDRRDLPEVRGKQGFAKQLVGIPWRVAFALQADGWYLRSDIIWSKPNPMPESVTDRPTKAHEYLFLLSKSPRYYYDADAVREAAIVGRLQNFRSSTYEDHKSEDNDADQTPVRVRGEADPSAGRNLRSVWSIATQPYPGAHFATFPEKLVEPCVKAGTSERGVCPECGAPWRREVEVKRRYVLSEGGAGADHKVRFVDEQDDAPSIGLERMEQARDGGANRYEKRWYNFPETTGWKPSCAHKPLAPVPGMVLDPFAGSGTTGRVAQRLGRRAVLIDLSGEYLVQTMARNRDIPLGLESA